MDLCCVRCGFCNFVILGFNLDGLFWTGFCACLPFDFLSKLCRSMVDGSDGSSGGDDDDDDDDKGDGDVGGRGGNLQKKRNAVGFIHAAQIKFKSLIDEVLLSEDRT